MSSFSFGTAVVVGASGGIGAALVEKIANDPSATHVFAVSRQHTNWAQTNVTGIAVEEHNEQAIKACLANIKEHAGGIHTLICTVGTLHNKEAGVRPEKRLEDISAEQLQHYFATNTVIPGLWLKNAVSYFDSDAPSRMVVFSARVGSISDNRVGGWYGYRASKAALNMLVKTAKVEYQRRAKNVALVSYHPGTVDTDLSKPFQRNVKPEKLFTPEFTASQLLSLLADMDPALGPYYLDWQGQRIEW